MIVIGPSSATVPLNTLRPSGPRSWKTTTTTTSPRAAHLMKTSSSLAVMKRRTTKMSSLRDHRRTLKDRQEAARTVTEWTIGMTTRRRTRRSRSL
jgi:hypothetical protein